MVDLSIIEQKIKDDPEIDQSIKDTLPKEKEDEVRSADPAYELKLYQNLQQAINDGDNAAQLNAYKKLQSYYISQETALDKVGVAASSILPGINKGIETTMGLPVDISNLILSFGEDGVRSILQDVGFDMESKPKIIGNQPFLGSESVGKLFDKLGIKTDYQKNRMLSQITGRISEEIGMTIPLMGITLRGASPNNMKKLIGIEGALATTGGAGAAVGFEANQHFLPPDSPIDLEAWGQALGYVSPITTHAIYKFLDKQVGIKAGFDTIFRPTPTANKIAANILFSKLSQDDIAKLLMDLETKNMSKQEVFEKFGLDKETVFGDAVNQTNFPRLLDEFFDNEQLTRLRQAVAQKDGGADLANALEAYFLTRSHYLGNRFDEQMKLPTDASVSDIMTFLKNAEVNQLEFINSKIIMAEQKAAEKMALFGNDLKIEDATSIFKMELESALDDMLIKEKQLWSKVGNKPNVNAIGDAAASIIANQFRTTDPNAIPKILYDLAGENRLIDLGVIKGKTKKETTQTRFGGKQQTETREVEVPGSAGLLDDLEGLGMDEVLNLKARLHDMIRQVDGTTQTGRIQIDNLRNLLSTVDDSLMSGINAKNMDAMNNAMSYTNKIQTEIYDSNVGNILNYNPDLQKIEIINPNKFNELLQSGQAGGVASSDFLKILNGESQGARMKLYYDINKMKNVDGDINRNTLQKYIQNNENLINQLGLTQEFADIDSVLATVATLQDDLARTKIQVGKDRKNVLLTNSDIDISNPQITKNIFNEKNKDKALNSVNQIKNLLSDDALAMNAFTNEVSDYMLNTIKTVTKKGEKVLDLQKTINFIDDNEAILKSIYGDNYATIVYFKDTLKEIQPKIAKGTLTLDAIEKNNVFVSALGRITGAKAGSMGLGPPLVLAGLGGRIANKLIGGKTEQEVYQILSQAFMDKDFAAQLIKPVNDEIAGQIESSINRLLNDNNAVFTTGTRLGETQVEKIQEQVRPDIQIDFPDARVDESGTIMPKEDETSSLNLNVNPNSRLATGFNAPTTQIASVNPDTMARGQQIFGADDPIFGMAKGGIMNTKKAFQRVA
jgi:hypothetical protein